METLEPTEYMSDWNQLILTRVPAGMVQYSKPWLNTTYKSSPRYDTIFKTSAEFITHKSGLPHDCLNLDKSLPSSPPHLMVILLHLCKCCYWCEFYLFQTSLSDGFYIMNAYMWSLRDNCRHKIFHCTCLDHSTSFFYFHSTEPRSRHKQESEVGFK